MTFRILTAEQQRRDLERRRFADIDRRLTAESKSRVSRGKDPRARQVIKRHVVTAIKQLPKTKQVLFVKREATRVHEEIKKQTRKIPTLQDIGMAGYKYGKAHPNSARLIYNSLDAKAKIIRKIVPKEAGIPVGKATFAFSDGAIKGIRNEPVKTLAFFALPGVAGVAIKGARYIPIASKMVKSERAMRAAAAGFNIVYTHNVYTRVNAPVLDYYKDGKVLSETSKKLQDGSIQITQNIEQVPVMRKPTTSEKSERLGYVFSTEAGPMVFGAIGVSKVSSARFKELSKTGVKTTKTTIKKLKKGTKEFIKHEKAQVLIIKPKAKPKAKPKPKIKPKVKTINLMKDTKSMAQLKRAKTSMVAVNRIASTKQVYKVQAKAKQVAQLKQKQKIITQKQALINSNIATRQKEIQKMVKSIESKLARGKEVKVLQKQLLKLKNEALDKQRNEIDALLKKIDEFFIAEAKASTKAASIALTKAKVKAKQAQTAKQKATQLNKVKELTKSLSKQRIILIAYSRRVVVAKQRKQITIIVNSIDEHIKPPPIPIIKPPPIPIIKPKPKPIPPPKKRVIEYPPKPKPKPIPKPKPKVKVIPVPKIPVPRIQIKRKVKPKKKKKMTQSQYRDWFVKNEIPTLKSLYG